MNPFLRRWILLSLGFICFGTSCLQTAYGQISTVLFQDDFSSNSIDPAKYQPDAPFFEGGVGDIHAEAGNGVMHFVGTTSQQWWAGGTLRVVPTFDASEATPVSVSIDRVSETGVGTASRSALWVLDETKARYVLLADVRAEGGWRYNRKIGEDGDVPTGSGTDMEAFNGGTFDDGGLHKMKMVANGQTVKLYVDNILGAEVKFPFSKIVFEFGSYARATGDTADTTWDNLRIETLRQTKVVFQDDFVATTIDPAKYQPDAPFFEGGVGDIHAEAGGGVMHFVGTTSQQWWAGGTLQVVPTFTASEQTVVMASIDRVSEAGVGTASRGALWILDESKTHYVLFADVRAEGGWRYNRKIGEDGDVPTGSGTDIEAFNGGTFDDGGLHQMGIIADGKTVKLLLDGQVGVEVKFPFPKVIFEFGSYARATGDTANTTWDNFKIETTVSQLTILFEDDFASNAIDPASYQPDAPFFEGGVGDIHAVPGNGVMKFEGTTSQQWWAGGTLRIVPTFEASEASVLTFSIDRVAEAGVGTASRSALWILDETRTQYVLFADVRAEGGWRYNRKIGEDGDVPTGSGTDILAFNGELFDNGGLHRMTMIADGKTVKLLLDDQQGAEVKFPFSPVVFEFGSYARATGDTAATTWDNLLITGAGGAIFDTATATVRVGQNSSDVTVKIPAGANSQGAVQLRITSRDPAIAIPAGGSNGQLVLTFPAGGGNTQTFKAQGVALGGTQFTLEGDIGGGNELAVAVVGSPGVLLEDNFAATAIDTAKWEVSKTGFETGTGPFTVTQAGGVLEISGSVDTELWPGASLKSKKSFVATPDFLLTVEVDRVSIEQAGTAGRTGVYLTTGDRSRYVFFGQNVGENNWQVNVNPGTPTGAVGTIATFAGITDTESHRMKLVADGENVEVFLDGVSGGKFPFAVASGIFVELGTYARASGDSVTGRFDNLRVENAVPCLNLSVGSVSMTTDESGKVLTVTVPSLLHDSQTLPLTITSRNPSVAIPAGAVNGALTLNFAAGGPNSQTFTVNPVGLGSTTFEFASTPPTCSTPFPVEVVSTPQVVLTDDFSGAAIDTTKWRQDDTPFETGTFAEGSGVTITNGEAKITVTAETAAWPGIALFTAQAVNATATAPATFEIDRTALDFVLVTGTAANERAGIWVKDAAGNFVFFSENSAHDGRNYGWQYNKQTGAADDNATGLGINIAAFDGQSFDDQGNHRMKIVVNGATARLYLDNVNGAELAFPFGQGITFGFGAYVAAATDVVFGYFDNALVTAGAAPTRPRVTATTQNGNVIISWTGTGVLQSATGLSATPAWVDVPNATSPYTVPAASLGSQSFFRTR